MTEAQHSSQHPQFCVGGSRELDLNSLELDLNYRLLDPISSEPYSAKPLQTIKSIYLVWCRHVYTFDCNTLNGIPSSTIWNNQESCKKHLVKCFSPQRHNVLRLCLYFCQWKNSNCCNDKQSVGHAKTGCACSPLSSHWLNSQIAQETSQSANGLFHPALLGTLNKPWDAGCCYQKSLQSWGF